MGLLRNEIIRLFLVAFFYKFIAQVDLIFPCLTIAMVAGCNLWFKIEHVTNFNNNKYEKFPLNLNVLFHLTTQKFTIVDLWFD